MDFQQISFCFLTLGQQRTVILVGVKLQDVFPSRSDPFGCHCYETEYEFLNPEIGLEPGYLFGIFTDDVAVKVCVYRCHNHKSRVFGQKRAGHLGPSEVVVHHIEDALTVSPVIIKFHYVFVYGLPVIGQDAPSGVLCVSG